MDASLDPGEIIKYSAWQKGIFFSKADGNKTQNSKSKTQNDRLKINTIRKLAEHVLHAKVNSVILLPHSTLHEVYLLKTGLGSYIVRTRQSVLRAYEFYLDRWAGEVLRTRGLPYADIKTVDLTRTDAPFDYEIMHEARGSSLFDLSRDGRKILPAIRNLGKVIGKIHLCRTRKYGPFDMSEMLGTRQSPVGIWDNWQRYMLLNLDRHIEICATAGLIDRTDVSGISGFLNHELGEIPEFAPVLVHGDVANHNAFALNGEITALIDWEDAVSGDPVYDIAYYATGCFGHDDWLVQYTDGYLSSAPMPANFRKCYAAYYLRITLAKSAGRIRNAPDREITLPDLRHRLGYAIRLRNRY